MGRCPLIDRECKKEDCEWWVGSEKNCAIKELGFHIGQIARKGGGY